MCHRAPVEVKKLRIQMAELEDRLAAAQYELASLYEKYDTRKEELRTAQRRNTDYREMLADVEGGQELAVANRLIVAVQNLMSSTPWCGRCEDETPDTYGEHFDNDSDGGLGIAGLGTQLARYNPIDIPLFDNDKEDA